MSTPRSSSPLNPNTSSDPLSSPTPQPAPSLSSRTSQYQSFSLPSYRHSLNSTSTSGGPLLSTRYSRPSSRKSSPIPNSHGRPFAASSGSKSGSSTSSRGGSGSGRRSAHGGGNRGGYGGASDLFSEGTTPTEGLMWREKFSRRVEERERRKSQREGNIDKRRGIDASANRREMSVEEEEEADRKAQEDDEEIFRRLVILQRKKTQHATLQSHELETGGSDPLLPDMEDELLNLEREERELMNRLDTANDDGNVHFQNQRDHNMDSSPIKKNPLRTESTQLINLTPRQIHEEEEWEREAALAEEQERDLEDINFADQVESHFLPHHPQTQQIPPIGGPSTNVDIDIDMDMDMDGQVDWEAFDAMDIE
ncbi:uncharacterized protein I303_102050 [Kwoniella dejecticola CBS 10117]|uniref:Uncharacterized protein n=1 Tax=Kwoniella dejecticola CBS 10117 TaxID=1296121 RepID=A0A1A6AC35_9TREE|nr:uncharacterized protein I303_01811 [Kwoniella dejecticola CBS 10117]OBR87603.1 hypothetical protein I303_01811 [Kwoniella dejecticola CBS 10117]